MADQVVRLRHGTMGADIIISGAFRTVDISDKGVWPLKNEEKATIQVKIGYRKGMHKS